jgi:uncharacterized membrane protein YoaK (UPF0700 family)
METQPSNPSPSEDGDAGGDDDSSGKKKSKRLEKDDTGSPTNKDIKQLDKAMRKTQKRLYSFPLSIRLCIVGVVLVLPLLIIGACIRWTDPAELATSVYVKTAIHCGFSFSTGWVNCIMLLRYRVFATMMVGNTILMGVAFVCNGGWNTAEEKDYWSWQGTQVRALCPAQFENAAHYLTMIMLFVLGTVFQGLLYKNLKWSARAFAPLCALVIISVEMMEYFAVIHDSKVDVYLLSPVFGVIVSISQNCGVGGVPWSATGNMTSAGFNFASWLSGFKSADIKNVLTNGLLWVACSWYHDGHFLPLQPDNDLQRSLHARLAIFQWHGISSRNTRKEATAGRDRSISESCFGVANR